MVAGLRYMVATSQSLFLLSNDLRARALPAVVSRERSVPLEGRGGRSVKNQSAACS